MKTSKRILCLLLAALLIMPFASAFTKEVLAEEDKVRIYMSPEGLADGQYYFDLSMVPYNEHWFTESRRQIAVYTMGMSSSEADAYAAEMGPKDYAAFTGAEWYIGCDSLHLSYVLTGDHDFSTVFDIDYTYYHMAMVEAVIEKGIDSVSWIPVAMPEHEDYVFDHGQYYFDMNSYYEDMCEVIYNFYMNHPEYTEGLTEEEIMQIVREEAIRGYVEPAQAIQYYTRPDDPLFRVKEVFESGGETSVVYYPYNAMTGLGSDDWRYVKEFHDYYWCNWEWIDKDHAVAVIVCYLGQEDGTNDVLRIEVTDIQQEVLREPTELTDGEVRCTAHIEYEGVVSTSTQNFPLPATGNPERVKITKQPESFTVSYPEGAVFSVEVNRPDLVASYQWIMEDEYKSTVLTGLTASTPVLEVKSTNTYDPPTKYYCVITDINGNKTVSEKGYLTIDNYQEIKPVLYVVDYALEPGDSLDLSETPIGSGSVTFDEGGYDIIFDNVTINSDGASLDLIYTPSQGIFLYGLPEPESTYTMYFKGKCTVNNTCYDPDFDGGGVSVNAHFLIGGATEAPLLVIDGDGDLTISGGLNSIYTDSDLEIRTSFKARPYENYRLNALSADSIHIAEGVHADIVCEGTGILANGMLFIDEGAEVQIKEEAPHLIMYNTESKGIYCRELYVRNAKLGIDMHASPENFEPYDKTISIMSGIRCMGSVRFEGSDVSIKLGADLGETYYAQNFYGITGDPDSDIREVELTAGSKVKINIDSKGAYSCSGIGSLYSEPAGFVTVGEGSELDIDVKTSGHVYGIYVGQPVSVTESTLRVKAASYDTAIVMGLTAPRLNIELTDSKYAVDISGENGIAVFATDPETVDGTEPEEGYKPQLIRISEDAKILVPEDGVVNRFGFDPYRSVISVPGETVYSKADMNGPASRVLIAVPKAPAPPTGDSLFIWLTVMAACLAAAYLLAEEIRKTQQR